MIHTLLFALFFVLFASRALGFDWGLAPGLSVKNAFLYLIFATLAIETALTRRRKLELLPVFVPFTIHVAYAIFTFLVIVLIIDYPGYDAIQGVMSLKAGILEHLLVLLIFFYGISDTEKGLWVLRRMVWLIIVANILTVLHAVNILDLGVVRLSEEGRVGGTIGNANEFASFVALFLPTIVVLYRSEKGLKKVLAGVGAFLSGLAFLMAVSRGAIVGLAVGGVLTAWYLRAVIPRQVLVRSGFGALLLGLVVIAGAFVTGYGDMLLERFGKFGEGSRVASSGRTMIWADALNSMLEYPLTFITGFGWNAYESSSEFHFATHNTYLNILYNLGIVGVVLFLVTAGNVLRAVRAGVNRAGPEAKPFLIAFVFGFMSLLVSIFFGGLHSSAIYVWAFVGLSLRIAVSQTSIESTAAKTSGTHSTAMENSRAAPQSG